MRKLLIALFALGLIFAFTAPAYATDASFSGYLRVRGFGDYNQGLAEDTTGAANTNMNDWYDQRLRLQTVFKVAEGLTITTRAHIMDRVVGTAETASVGSANYATLTQDDTTKDVTFASGTNKNNIYFHRAYMTFKTGIGKFDVGYMSGGTFGTVFGDTEADGRWRIKYTGVVGPWILLALTEHFAEMDYIQQKSMNVEDNDYDTVALAGIYRWEGGQAGFLQYFLWNRTARTASATDDNANYTSQRFVSVPYVKANFGALYLEAEILYQFGTMKEYELAGTNKDVDYDGGVAWYINGKFNMGPAYVGAIYAYAQGDDPTTVEDYEGAYTGSDWNPCLILFNDDLANRGSWGTTTASLANGSLVQVNAGFSPMEKLNLFASLTYAWADEKKLTSTTTAVDDEIGTEFDISATYKIFDNLEYYIGFGYLFAGDWYKGTDSTNKVDDGYLIMHKIQMNF